MLKWEVFKKHKEFQHAYNLKISLFSHLLKIKLCSIQTGKMKARQIVNAEVRRVMTSFELFGEQINKSVNQYWGAF